MARDKLKYIGSIVISHLQDWRGKSNICARLPKPPSIKCSLCVPNILIHCQAIPFVDWRSWNSYKPVHLSNSYVAYCQGWSKTVSLYATSVLWSVSWSMPRSMQASLRNFLLGIQVNTKFSTDHLWTECSHQTYDLNKKARYRENFATNLANVGVWLLWWMSAEIWKRKRMAILHRGVWLSNAFGMSPYHSAPTTLRSDSSKRWIIDFLL